MRKALLMFFTIGILMFSFSVLANAQTYRVAIGDLPGIDQFIDLVKTMGKEMNVELEIIKVPMPRMIYMIQSKKADIGAPMLALKNKEAIKMLPFDYSTSNSGGGICFVLYTNKLKQIDIPSLSKGNPNNYMIETDPTNANYFNFKTSSSTNPEGSLKKVDIGRIDGYIIAQIVGDPLLRALKLKNVHRQFYDKFESVFVLQKGARGGEVDKFITAGMNKMWNNKKLYDLYIGPAIEAEKYEDWQP